MESVQTAPKIHLEAMSLKLGTKELRSISKALSSKTRQKIIQILNQKPMDVSRIAQILEQTEANVSAQIAILQKNGLVSCEYQSGLHGVRKVCSVAVKTISIDLF